MFVAKRPDGTKLAKGDTVDDAIHAALAELALTATVRYTTRVTGQGVVVSGATDAGDFQFIVTEEPE